MEIGKPTIVDVKESANEGQIGGQHYKRLAIQPWDYILQNDIGYMEGAYTKLDTSDRVLHKTNVPQP
jgi:hypothetical protein